jgi:hypothetical protein
MRRIEITQILAVIAILVITACNKNDEVSDQTIEGTYNGTLTASTLKNTSGSTLTEVSATAVISMLNDEEIEVHCYSDVLDTTFMLNYYESSHDSVMVCLTGDDFEHRYGHSLGQGHMMGGMMGDRHEGETEWEHHMADEHSPGDEHFGGFDSERMTFGYRFQMEDGDTSYQMNFHGTKGM